MYALSDISNDLFCLVIMAIIFACHLQSTSTRQSTGLFQKSNFARRRAANLH